MWRSDRMRILFQIGFVLQLGPQSQKDYNKQEEEQENNQNDSQYARVAFLFISLKKN